MTEIQRHHAHTFTHALHSYSPVGEKTHLLVLLEDLGALSFFLNILEFVGGSSRDPTKISHTLSLLLLLRLCLPHPVAPTLSLLSLWFLSNTLKHTHTHTHTHVSTAGAPPRQVNRCVTAQTSSLQRKTGSTCSPHSTLLPPSALPWLFIRALTHSQISHGEQGPFN